MCCCCEFGGGGFDGGVGRGWECGYGGEKGIYDGSPAKKKKNPKKTPPFPPISIFSAYLLLPFSSPVLRAERERIKKKEIKSVK